MSKIACALPAFAGQLTADDRNRIGAISRTALRRGIAHTAFDIEEIIDSADRKLFTRITHPGHCLYIIFFPQNLCILPLLSPEKATFSPTPSHRILTIQKTVLSIDVYLNSDD